MTFHHVCKGLQLFHSYFPTKLDRSREKGSHEMKRFVKDKLDQFFSCRFSKCVPTSLISVRYICFFFFYLYIIQHLLSLHIFYCIKIFIRVSFCYKPYESVCFIFFSMISSLLTVEWCLSLWILVAKILL